MDRQFTVTEEQANFRQEPHMDGAILTKLLEGAIVHLDPDRKPVGEWVPVLYFRGWMHKSVLRELVGVKNAT